MLSEYDPIIVSLPKEWDSVEIFAIHDVHYGNEFFDQRTYDKLIKYILEKENRMIVWVGDLIENCVPNSKGDILTQVYSPQQQTDWLAEQFTKLADRTLAIVDGNHEFNRSTRFAGLYPLFTAAAIARIDDKYRSAFAVLDVSVGSSRARHKDRQAKYVGFLTHRAKDLKSFNTVDELDGFDFAFYGHDHEPSDHPRAKLVYVPNTRTMFRKNVEVVNNGAFLDFGGYSPRSGMRPKASKNWTMTLFGGEKKRIDTHGFDPRCL